MNIINQFLAIILLMSFAIATAFATEFSKIEEEMLLNPPGSGGASDKVMIYTRVRDETVNKAMDNQFHRIENMMFINTVVESETGDLVYTDSEECD